MPRALKWYTKHFTDVALASGLAIQQELLGAVDQANQKGSTVTRLIIDVWGQCDTENTRKRVDMGILWVDGDAFTAGAFPDPEIDTERADWLWRATEQYIGTSGSSGGVFSVGPQRRSWDIRSQRICRADTDMLMMLFKTNAVTTGGIFVTGAIRTLLRLP